MAWVESRTLRSGEKRFRVVERGADGRLVKGKFLLSRRDAERLAARTGLEKQRDELGLIKRDYRIADLVAEIGERLSGRVSASYTKRTQEVGAHLLRFLKARAPRTRMLSELTKPVLLAYQRFRLDEASRPPAPREIDLPGDDVAELTIAQVARVIGYRHNAVLRLVHEKVLPGRKVKDGNRPGFYLVPRCAVTAFMATPRYERGRRRAAANAKRRAQAAKAATASKTQPPKKRIRNRTINNEIQTIRTLLNKAVVWGLLDDTPIANTKGLLLPEHDSKAFRALTEEEFVRFRRMCPDWVLAPCLAAGLLGLREEEVRQLEWSDLDLSTWTLHLRNKATLKLKSQGHTGIREFTMTVPDALRPVLSELSLQREGFDDNLVFHNSVGKQFPKGALRKLLTGVLRSCGIEDVTQFHALRKTFITHMARKVDNVFLLQKLARHRDIRTTGRYVNVFADDERRALESFDIGGAPASPPPPAASSPGAAPSAG